MVQSHSRNGLFNGRGLRLHEPPQPMTAIRRPGLECAMAQRWKFAVACALLFAPIIHAQAQTTPASPLAILIAASTPEASPLTPDSLRVTVDKKPAQVLSLRSARADKLLFVLLIDFSGSQAPDADVIRHAATQIFEQLSSQGDVGYLGVFSDSLRLSNGPILASGVVPRVLDRTQFSGGTSLYDAVAESGRQLSGREYAGFPRRAMIVLSDGEDDNSNLSLLGLLNTVEPEGVPIFSIITPKGGRMGRRALKLMSSLTGGEAVAPRTVDAGVAPLLAALEQQWELTIAPPAIPRGKLELLSVRSTQKQARIYAPDQVELP